MIIDQSIDSGCWDVADFPRFEYSKKAVVRAGDAIARDDLIWTPNSAGEIVQTFKIANNWIDSHAYPMARVRYELVGCLNAEGVSGLTAARLKRMRSIRRKLVKHKGKLNQIQDLGGCRAILPTMEDVRRVVDGFPNRARHSLKRTYDYIERPKPDGYRSYHLVFEFCGKDEEKIFDGRLVEVQIRSRLQHAWATAVEAVGLFRSEDLKGGDGDPNWLRFFALMSAELAVAENCPVGDTVPPAKERLAEIRELDSQLDASTVLDGLNQAFRYTDSYIRDSRFRPGFFLIQYDTETKLVSVKEYAAPILGAKDYHEAERTNDNSGKIKSVLVEADKLDALKDAYPNYFGDVYIFTQNLLDITKGKGAKEYTMPPQQRVPPPPKEVPAAWWFRRTNRHRG